MVSRLARDGWCVLGPDPDLSAWAEAAWPVAEPALLVEDTVTLPIQVNGKKRGEITVARDADRAAIEALVMDEPAVQRALEGGQPKKLIVVPGRIVNVVV